MKIETIQTLLAELNAAASKKKAPVKKPAAVNAVVAAAFPVKTNGHANGHAALTPEDHLAMSARRIAEAFDLKSRGITAESLVARVHFVEAQAKGVIQ